ncbi:MAG: hypothetical protein AAF939_01325 [Planctomycetota bacterium]
MKRTLSDQRLDNTIEPNSTLAIAESATDKRKQILCQLEEDPRKAKKQQA